MTTAPSTHWIVSTMRLQDNWFPGAGGRGCLQRRNRLDPELPRSPPECRCAREIDLSRFGVTHTASFGRGSVPAHCVSEPRPQGAECGLIANSTTSGVRRLISAGRVEKSEGRSMPGTSLAGDT